MYSTHCPIQEMRGVLRGVRPSPQHNPPQSPSFQLTESYSDYQPGFLSPLIVGRKDRKVNPSGCWEHVFPIPTKYTDRQRSTTSSALDTSSRLSLCSSFSSLGFRACFKEQTSRHTYGKCAALFQALNGRARTGRAIPLFPAKSLAWVRGPLCHLKGLLAFFCLLCSFCPMSLSEFEASYL